MTRTYLGNTFFAIGVCLDEIDFRDSFGHLLLSRQAPKYYLKRKVFIKLGYDGLLKNVASRTLDDCFMRAWMTGLILAIFGLWLATI